MATRDFTDANGRLWRAWDVTPEHLHPLTRTEEFMEPWVEGWLAFECDGEKRRLAAPYPSKWADYEPDKLCALLRAATPFARHTGPIALPKLDADLRDGG